MKIFKTKNVKTPNRGTPKSGGIDFFAPEFEDFIYDKNPPEPKRPFITLQSGESVLIASGIKVNIPVGYALIAFNKSGLAIKNIIVGACFIDEDYTGEMHIDLKNIGQKQHLIYPGDKIAQFACIPINYVSINEVDSEEECFRGKTSERGEGGFGSTGNK